jgi:hypothetical protein
MNVAIRWSVIFLAGVLLWFSGGALIGNGMYGLTLFVAMPVLIGGFATLVLQPASAGQAARQGALVILVFSVALLLLNFEGLFCILMTLPLALPLGALGATIAFRIVETHAGHNGFAVLALLPMTTMMFDAHAKAPVFAVRTAVEVAATPQQVWKYVIEFPELAEPSEWYFLSGIAYPKRARMEGSGTGAVRYCEFSTGPFVEPIQVWDEAKLLRFSVTESPAPMTELSPYADLAPRHLRGYFTSKQGEFRLTPLAGNRTLLEGTTWYQHGLWPAQYWRCWSDAIIHRIHLRVLQHIRALAEQ